jgi:MoxR-like ATPase
MADREIAGAVWEKFDSTRREMNARLIERAGEVDLLLVGLLAQEHVLLIGPPGCGKSLTLDGLLGWMSGRKFSVLVNKFTTPEEVFGPVSIRGLKEDVYRRVTAGKLPEADLALIDEIWKASSAILNTLLRILNERTFEPGDGSVVKVPLKLCVAASNEWPSPETGKELSALFDRFLLRKAVSPVRTRAGLERLLWEKDHSPKLSTSVTEGELRCAAEAACGVGYSPEAKEALLEVLREIKREGVVPGDRRQHKAVKVARCYAWLSGAERVLPEHLEVLQHVLWDDPQEQPRKCAQAVARICNPAGMQIAQCLLEAEEIAAAADVRNLSQAAAAAAKLQEVVKKLRGLAAGGRRDEALAHVQEQLRLIKMASLEAV